MTKEKLIGLAESYVNKEIAPLLARDIASLVCESLEPQQEPYEWVHRWKKVNDELGFSIFIGDRLCKKCNRPLTLIKGRKYRCNYCDNVRSNILKVSVL
ncbi:MAG: hypothetical protein EOM23_08085 [Candidatus Moranbacteria bacterium]|nr:hypothetical protein [Candidatus Moranbacteria bacterium]